MRLTPDECRALTLALAGEPRRAVYLYGSRLNDAARGGDIDLLIHADLAPAEAFNMALRIASRFAREFDAKLDVQVVNPAALTEEQQAFLATLTLEPLDEYLGLRSTAA